MKYDVERRLSPPDTGGPNQFALDLSEAFRAKCMDLLEYASKPHHYYKPRMVGGVAMGNPRKVPGRNAKHRVRSGDYRIVYSVTAAKGRRWRHLSMSVIGGRLPHMLAVFTVCDWMGFTGAERDDMGLVHEPAPTWQCWPSKVEQCVAVIEEIR